MAPAQKAKRAERPPERGNRRRRKRLYAITIRHRATLEAAGKKEVSWTKTPPQGPILKEENGPQDRNKRIEMCALPSTSQKEVFKNWLEAVDVRFMELRQHPISEVLDKMIEMLVSSVKPKGREAGDLIFKELIKKRKERNRPLAKGGTYGVVTKKWLFGSLELQFAQSKGTI